MTIDTDPGLAFLLLAKGIALSHRHIMGVEWQKHTLKRKAETARQRLEYGAIDKISRTNTDPTDQEPHSHVPPLLSAPVRNDSLPWLALLSCLQIHSMKT